MMAKEWGEDMRLYYKICSNPDCLALGEQIDLCKRFGKGSESADTRLQTPDSRLQTPDCMPQTLFILYF